MAEFKHSYLRTAKWEGGYVNHKSDAGKETYCGISRKFHPSWGGWAIVDSYKPIKTGAKIKNTDLENAVRLFYYHGFWQPIKGDLIEHQDIADFVYDWHVNSGEGGIKAIQRALGLKDDGKVGNITLGKLQTAKLIDLIEARIYFVQAIVNKNPSQKVFLAGWLNRINSFR